MNEERLETLLSVYRYRRPMPDFRSLNQPRAAVFHWTWLAAAAAVLVIIAITLRPRTNEWTIGVIPHVVRAGDVVNSNVRLRSRAVGVIDVGNQTTLRFLGRNRFELTAGTIHAKTTSPPGIFIVDTPRARAVDLGCEYTLTIATNGTGLLRVSAGWVGLNNWGQSLVPQGAKATIGPHGRLSPPIFEDASPAFQEAILRGDLKTALPLARRRDALTLINLFRFATTEERLMVYDRLNQLVPAPPSVTRDAIRNWEFLTVDPWWADVLKASGVNAIKKKKRMLPPA